MFTELSDGDLVERLQSGELDALGELYERHNKPVYRTALAITHDPSRAEDILQDCFLRLHRYVSSIDKSLPLRPWLYRVTVNLAYSMEKRRKRWQIPLDWVGQKLISPIDLSPEIQAEKNHAKNEVIGAIASLKFNQRIVIALYYPNSFEIKEIAGILDCPIGTIKSRLYYGRENLRKQLDKKPILLREDALEFVA